MNTSITIKEVIQIRADQKSVWAFTQDFNNRQKWDSSILELEILQTAPYLLILIKTQGGVRTKLKYKLWRKPSKTSLEMIDTKSLLIKGGGGSWTYSTIDSMTEWTQTNTLVFKNIFLFLFFGWIVKLKLQRSTQNSMLKAKQILEQSHIDF